MAIDQMIEQGETENKIDILRYAESMRENRVGMIQTPVRTTVQSNQI